MSVRPVAELETFCQAEMPLAGSLSRVVCNLVFSFFCMTNFVQEKAMAPHSSTLAWKIPWTEGPGGLQSMGP